MDRKRIAIVVGTACVLALLAGVGAYKFLSAKNRMAEKARLQTVGIVSAVVDIPLGATINPNQVSVIAWPKGHHPKDAFPDVKSTVGRIVLRDFQRGEPIVESKLVPADKGSGILTLKIPQGMRAFSVKVNEVVGVGGFIVPDTRVDVLVTTALSSRRQQDQFSKTILQDVLILAAGQAIEQKDNKPVTVNTVTLSVTPEEAEKLALASNDGKIQLVLRNFSDAEKMTTSGIDKSRLLASYRTEPPAVRTSRVRYVRKSSPAPPPARRVQVVEVLKGTKRTEEKFD